MLDAGPDRADFCLLDGGRPVLARSLSGAGAALWESARTDPRAADRLLSPLARDLKLSLRMRGKAGALSRLLVAGDLARLPGAAERLSAELGVPVEPLALTGEAAQVAQGPGADYALALGLALRAQQPRGRLNFRKGEFAFTRDLSQVRGHLVQLAIAAAVLLALAVGLGAARVASLSRQARDYDDALCAATRKILGTCMTDYRQAIAALSGGRSKAAGIPRVSAADVLARGRDAHAGRRGADHHHCPAARCRRQLWEGGSDRHRAEEGPLLRAIPNAAHREGARRRREGAVLHRFRLHLFG